MQAVIDRVKEVFPGDEKLADMFGQCFVNTYETTMKPMDDGTTFVITGDIPAMWLRDSALQVRPYLIIAENDSDMADAIEGVINRQFYYINHDPYANAFNEYDNGERYHDDETAMTPLIWERKYELDSLCFPLLLAYLFWKATGRTSHFNESFKKGAYRIVQTMTIEQDHEEASNYHFERHGGPESDTLVRNGKGSPVIPTGMVWSGFRPSDDACQYGYLIPANMFAVVVLGYLQEIAGEVLKDQQLEAEALRLEQEIECGLKEYATVDVPGYGRVFAYETDGLGHYNLMDDGNVPSLLSLPYLGYCKADDPVYQNTRRYLLSDNNPYFYEGTAAKGIGSPHTPENYIWHIALAIQGLTAKDTVEKQGILSAFKTTDAGTGYMHEGFHADNPNEYTRSWFAWANSMFSEFVLSLSGRFVKGSPLEEWGVHE
ncbi:glycoside hydrolase family 125 protein [Scopulibacillus darangshiensis]|nr:glycoside hydrolase family 125 protein [Scopulibacillus darangshiensis]